MSLKGAESRRVACGPLRERIATCLFLFLVIRDPWDVPCASSSTALWAAELRRRNSVSGARFLAPVDWGKVGFPSGIKLRGGCSGAAARSSVSE